MPATGSKAQVFHGTAVHTSGGLTKKDLVLNKHGRIVSRRKMMLGKKAVKHLFASGYKPKKGTFKLNWKDIRELREEHLASAGDTVRPLLEAAQRRGDLMAKIHERNPPAPPKPARAPRAAQGEQLFDGVEFTDDFFRDEDLGELLEPAEAHHSTQPQGEDDEPLQLDLEDAGSVYPFPDNSDDEAEWGLLGFGSPGP
jgi:hypothetical protein